MKKLAIKYFRDLLEQNGWSYRNNYGLHEFKFGKYTLKLEPSYERRLYLYYKQLNIKIWKWYSVRKNIDELYKEIKDLMK
jgi:hypothetical protein